MRPTYAEIDLAAVAHNVATIVDVISPSSLCAVVKADAYGHGDVPVAETALAAGAKWLAVALVEEGVRLREGGVEAPILLLSEPDLEGIDDLLSWDLTPAVYTNRFLDALIATGAPSGVHLKVDTGMHRVGAAPVEASALLDAIGSSAKIGLDAVWTHFAVADEDRAYTAQQIEVFDRFVEGREPPMVHMANTAGALLFPEARRDMCRIGLGIYGLHPCHETEAVVGLRPAMRLVSRVTHVQRLEAGERPSYGRIRPLPRVSNVATIPVGYADGFARAFSEGGSVLLAGRRFQLAGRVTMDQVVVDVGTHEVAVGDEVVLIGDQGDERITADDWAEALGTISYEVVCSIGPRVPRRYA